MKNTACKSKSGALMLAAGTLLLAFSCTKEPSAAFSTDKTDYNAGEVIRLSNTSTNADAYVWTFPNGRTSTAQEPTFSLSDTASSGEYNFTLKATNKGKKSSSTSQTVKVKAISGTLTAWTSNNTVGQIMVQVDGQNIGTIGAYYQFSPGCGANGCVNTTLSVGVHTVTSVYASTSSSGTVSIKRNTCTVFQLE